MGDVKTNNTLAFKPGLEIVPPNSLADDFGHVIKDKTLLSLFRSTSLKRSKTQILSAKENKDNVAEGRARRPDSPAPGVHAPFLLLGAVARSSRTEGSAHTSPLPMQPRCCADVMQQIWHLT